MSRDISLLHPELREICRRFLAECAAQGLKAAVADGFRTKAEQDALYAQGRTAPGSIVTNARYPMSAHNWGLAFDIYRNDGMGAYNNSGGWFERCGRVGKAMGLFWGGDFASITDKPHFELKALLPGNSVSQLVRKYGTPEKFMNTWKESDTITQEQFSLMMEEYLRQREQKAPSGYAAASWSKAADIGILDGTMPHGWLERQQLAVVLDRLGLLGEGEGDDDQ